MMKKNVLLVLVTLVFVSCNTGELEFENLKVQPLSGLYVLPLGSTTYTMRDLIDEISDEELNLEEDENAFLTLIYTDSFTYSIDDDFVNIDDIIQNDVIPVPAGNNNDIIPLNTTITLTYEDEDELQEVYYNGGQVSIVTNAAFGGNLTYSYTLLNTTSVSSGRPIVLNGSIADGQGTDTQRASLTGHRTFLDANNQFSILFQGEIQLGPDDVLTGSESITFEITYANQSFSLIIGNFGQDTVLVGSETMDIGFFEDSGNGGIYFGDPTITFDFINEYGIPLGIDFSALYATDGDVDTVFLSGSITDAPLAEIGTPSSPDESEQSTIQINQNNSNLVDLLASSPTQFGFDVQAISNANDAGATNFIQPGSVLQGFATLELPMELRLENFQRSFGVGLDTGLDTDDVDSAYIRIRTINELPFSGSLIMEIQDESDNTIYTVPENLVFNASVINSDGILVNASNLSANVQLSPEGVDALEAASRLYLTVTLNTPPGGENSENQYVEVLGDYALNIDIGLGLFINKEL